LNLDGLDIIKEGGDCLTLPGHEGAGILKTLRP